MQDQTLPESSNPIDWWRYIAILKRWLWLLVLSVTLGACVAFFISNSQLPVYQATATILINAAPNTTSGTDYSSMLASGQIAGTYARLFTERMVLDRLVSELPITTSVEELQEMIQVSVVRNTQLMELKVENTNPEVAAYIANNLVTVFSDVIQDMQSQRYQDSKSSLQLQMKNLEDLMQATREELSTLGTAAEDDPRVNRLEASLNQYQQSYTSLLQTFEQIRLAEAQTSSSVTQVSKAVPPDEPIRPRTVTNTLLGAVIGLLLAAGMIFLIENLDDTLRSISDIPASLGLSLLSFLPRVNQDDLRKGPVTHNQPRSPIAERFRSLRTNIQYASVDKPLRVILVTSPTPSDGKTTVVSNLATALAQSGKRVTIVDADMRRPRIHKEFTLHNVSGLSTLFVSPSLELGNALQPTNITGLSVVTAGRLPPNPAELLASDKMSDILRVIGESADMIIIDTPPATVVTDAIALATRVDGVIVVINLAFTRLGALRHTVDELRRVGTNILGAVVNGVDAGDIRYNYGKYYHYYSDDRVNASPTRNPVLRVWQRIRHIRSNQSTVPHSNQDQQEA